MRSCGPSATVSSERPGSPHSDTVENTDRLNPSGSSSMERNGGNYLSTSGEPVRNEGSGAPLQTSSARHSLRQTEVDELGNDSEAETGYSSYADYLRAYNARSPYLNDTLFWLTTAMAPSSRKSQFTILDLSNDAGSKPLVLSRRDRMSDTNIVTSLQQAPANVAVQILLWETTDFLNKGVLSQDVVDSLGLGLKLDPRFFTALDPGNIGQNRRPWDPKHVTIAGAVATIIRHPKPDKADAIPVVLIAMRWEVGLAKAVEEEIGDTYPFQPSAAETCPVYASRDKTGSLEHQNYTRLLQLVS